jgi:hypothetical protein
MALHPLRPQIPPSFFEFGIAVYLFLLSGYDVTIAEIEAKLESVEILMNPEQISKTLEHIFALAPVSIS